MAYIWITSQCQQRCRHCCNAKHLGNDHMEEKVWRAAIDFTVGTGSNVVLGGGEPLLHPHIERVVFTALGHPHTDGVWFATNGLETQKAICFANMAKGYGEDGKFTCALSIDDYHEEVHHTVEEAFEGLEIRNVTGKEVNNGNCDFGDQDRCGCDDYQIMVDGRIRMCGCDDAPYIGDVFDGIDPTIEDQLNALDERCFKEFQKEYPDHE
jgi:MoaA/NifB/PqqE/SkfB family radical SAM enzyme